jgi:hypothetical protein
MLKDLEPPPQCRRSIACTALLLWLLVLLLQLLPSLHLENIITTPTAQVFCMFLFMAGASLFGTLLSQLGDILQNINRESRNLSDHLELYISFMSEYG